MAIEGQEPVGPGEEEDDELEGLTGYDLVEAMRAREAARKSTVGAPAEGAFDGTGGAGGSWNTPFQDAAAAWNNSTGLGRLRNATTAYFSGVGQEVEDTPVDLMDSQALGNPERLSEVQRSVRRAGVKAVDETVEAVAGTAGAAASALGLTDKSGREIGESLSISDAAIDRVMGRRSDDAVAATVESVVQFGVGFVGLGKFTALGKIAKAGGLSGWAANAARGAVADYSVMDPYEESLSEFFAQDTGWTDWVPGGKELGQVLSVEEDGGIVEARLKRLGEGLIAGTAIDVVTNMGRIYRSIRKVKAQKSPEAAEELRGLLESHEARVREIESASYTPEGAHVVVRPSQTVDGGFDVRLADETPIRAEGAAGDNVVASFADRAEAETQAGIFNGAVKARFRAQEFDGSAYDDILTSFRENIHRTPDELFEAMEATGHFNVGYIVEPQKVLSMMEAITTRISDQIDEFKVKGDYSMEGVFEAAAKNLSDMTRFEAPAVIIERLGQGPADAIWHKMAEMVRTSTHKRLAEMAQLMEHRPHDMILAQEVRLAVRQQMQLDMLLAGDKSMWGLTGRVMQEGGDKAGHRSWEFAPEGGRKPEVEPKKPGGNGKGPKEPKAPKPKLPDPTSGMTARQLREYVTTMRYSGGVAVNPHTLKELARRTRDTRKRAYVVEWFINSLLSAVPTTLTPIVSGVATMGMELGSRALAGGVRAVTHGDTSLLRETVDLAAAHKAYFADNLQSFWRATKAGHSLINPQGGFYSMGGLHGEILRTPTRAIGAMDEWVRVSNYRAHVRAKTLRRLRADGITGKEALKRADQAVKDAFYDNGAAKWQESLDFAEVPTFSGKLNKETLSGKIHGMTNEHIETKIIAPFIKAGVNIFDYAWQSTPGLNRLNRKTKEALAKGGEEAAIVHARSFLATSIFSFTMMQAAEGNITGRGPSDHALRSLAYKDGFRPYSIKIPGTDKWVSYRRLDPMGYFIGMAADINELRQESGDGETEWHEAGYGALAALVGNMSSKLYMQGLSDFAEAWTKGDEHTMKRWLQGFGSNLAVPNLANTMNPDPLMREVRGMVDAIRARTPWLSDELMPRFDAFGEPIHKVRAGDNEAVNLANRALNPIQVSDRSDRSLAAQELLEIRTSLPAKPVEYRGLDLSDEKWDTKGVGMRPYERWMQLVRNPKHGGRGFEQELEDLVSSPEWERLSPGTHTKPGGERRDRVLAVRDRHFGTAFQQVLNDYPRLREALEAQRAMSAAAKYEGEAGEARVRSQYRHLADFLGW